MPELKVPQALSDLYWDLRDRRLLPLVGLVLLAIVAVPLLLGGDSGELTPPPQTLEAADSAGQGDGAARLAVVEAKPGLRDYRKRLEGRTPTDPFEQRYTGPASKGGQLNDSGGATTSTSLPTEASPTKTSTPVPTEAPPSSGALPGDGSGDSGGGNAPGLKLFTFAIDVKISKSETKANGRTVMGEPTIRHRVMPTTPLPGEKAPVVTYMGANAKSATKALLMISNNVKSVFGDAKCLSGTDTCQLIEVEPGFPQTFVYGPNDVRYKVNVIKIEAVISGHS